MSIPESVTLNCPTWCTSDHGRYLPDELWNGGIIHSAVIGKIPTSNSGANDVDAVVEVVMLDSLDNGRRTPEVQLSCRDEMTPATARLIAGLLVDASVVAELPVPPAPVIPWLDRPGNRCPGCGRRDRISFIGLVSVKDQSARYLCGDCGESWTEPPLTDPFRGARYEKDATGAWVLVQPPTVPSDHVDGGYELHHVAQPLPDVQSVRSARPGELCSCGRPAVRVYFTDDGEPVGYCGIPDGGAR